MRPTLHGVLETALYVEDLERAQKFYQRVFGFAVLLADERMCALEISGEPLQILLLFVHGGSIQSTETPGGPIPPHDARGQIHLAFSIEVSQIKDWRKYLQACGIEIESEVKANQGHSIYFRDPDHHCIEVGTVGLWNRQSF